MREFLNSFQKLEFDKVKKYIQRYALSDLGRELIERLLPSSDLNLVEENLRLVSEMKSLLEGDDPLPLENIFDVRSSLHRSTIENYILSSDELHKIELLLKTSRVIQIYFARRAQTYPSLFSRSRGIYIEKVIEYNIGQAIDDEGRVKDSASKELSIIRKQIVRNNDHLKYNLESILKNISGKDWVQEEIITTREGRMVIPVKVEHKNRVPGFIHSASASGATVFIEPTETLELNNEIQTLHFQEQREIERILRNLTEQVRDSKEKIVQDVRILGELDFIQAKAKYSVEVLGIQPRINEEGSLKLVNALHPILLQRHDRKNIVPLHLEISDNVNTLIITGPNAGGKSVAMKTVGLLSLLSQSGCHIPVSPETELMMFSDIFVDMGDEQSIEDDLSSFSSHLRNLKQVIENANERSLVLIDEIGSGTDPTEGASLAAAILERLTDIGSINIVTTHHGALKTFAFEHSHIQNGAMEFDQHTLQPTYRFRSGIPGSSYAIEMAERMEIPKDIIQRSRTLKGTDANKLENLIIDLERHSQELKNNLEKVDQDRNHLNSLNEFYERKVNALETELKAMKLRAIEEARSIIGKANAIIEKSVQEIKESTADREVIKRAKEEVKKLEEEFSVVSKELSAPHISTDFNVGDHVRLRQSNTSGEIESKLDIDHYLVLMGELKVKVHRDDLEYSAENHQVRKAEHIFHAAVEDIKREIDLRGMYGDEAISAIDKFLDDAVLAGLHRVDLIHGKGTGALRRKINEYLKKNSSIKSFRLGEWNEGGTGVTVVELL
ncbi:MAG: endonuclease MutS2 [Ignavibacteria bacterium]|nr:endonuclease MutS2 [Ignavibacteria bacterium]